MQKTAAATAAGGVFAGVGREWPKPAAEPPLDMGERASHPGERATFSKFPSVGTELLADTGRREVHRQWGVTAGITAITPTASAALIKRIPQCELHWQSLCLLQQPASF